MCCRISFQAQRRRSRAADSSDEGPAPPRHAQRDPIQDPDEALQGADAGEAADMDDAVDADAGLGSRDADAAGAGLPSWRPQCATDMLHN